MRFLAIILSLYISTFALCPAVKQVIQAVVKADMCCSSSCKDKAEENQSSNSCNKDQKPMDCCCNCPYINGCIANVVTQQVFEFHDFEKNLQKVIPTNEDISSFYMSDCWHPPKFV